MSPQAKRAYISGISLLGLLFLLLGIITHLHFTTGLIIAIVLWVISGILARYWRS
jgi:hypothetical protein